MPDNLISQRAKQNLPTVLLTLLSIVQALALELLWAHLTDQSDLYAWGLTAILGWLQIAATLLGILLIWLIYSGLVMRFTWVPSTSDTVFPFVVGVVEFAHINALGSDGYGAWFILTGVLFAAMTWIGQVTMRRARQDSDNDDFFKGVTSATWKDHLQSLLPAGLLFITGGTILIIPVTDWFLLAATILVIGFLSIQLWLNHIFIRRSYNQL